MWEKKWVVLGNNHVYIYSSDNTEDADPVEEFDLRPSNGFVTIRDGRRADEHGVHRPAVHPEARVRTRDNVLARQVGNLR